MRIPITINGKSVILDSDPEQNLLSALRRLKLFSVKCGCCQGLCASCTVLIGDRAVSSCLIPVASVRNQQIITLEYFKQTESYTDIIKGFESNDYFLPKSPKEFYQGEQNTKIKNAD